MDSKDAYFIKQLTKGDEKAYKQLYSRYYAALCYHAVRILEDNYLAEEAVQTVLYKLWEKRKNLQINTSLHAYLYRSVVNTSLNILKREKRLNRGRFNLAEIEEYYFISEDNGYSVYAATEFEDKIIKAIETLPGQCRKIFELSRFENKPHKEIAEELGITQNTVQKQISIALQKIRDSLKGYIIVLYMFFSQHGEK